MRTYNLYQVDAFTTAKFKGNPAGVVTNALGLSDAEMQWIARELNNSETAFILPPEDTTHDVRLRYFTPTIEVPSCGHATIAAHYVRAVEQQLAPGRLIQKIGAGTLPVDIVSTGRDYMVWMTQGRIEFSAPLAPADRQDLLAALGLTDRDLDERCPIQIVSTGHSKVLIGITSRTRLNALTPDLTRLSALSRVIGCNGYYVFTLASTPAAELTYGRMFAPAIGIAEDPVTGNANGPLGAYLVKHRLVAHNNALFAFSGAQGEAIGRDGVVLVEVAIMAGEPVQVRVGGTAVIVYKAQLEL